LGGRWIQESQRAGQRTVWVHHLSLLGSAKDAVGTLKAKALKGLCLSSTPSVVLSCLAKKGLKKVPSMIVVELLSLLPGPQNSCVRHIIEHEIGGALEGPAGIVTGALVAAFSGPCVGKASSPGCGAGCQPYDDGHNDNGSTPGTSAPPPPPTPPAGGGNPPPATNTPFTGGYTISDAYLSGTWPRTDPWNGTWYSQSNRPPNGASYWWKNGLGVGFSCGMHAASYTVSFAGGRKEIWNTWLRSTDMYGGRVTGLWVPSATLSGLNVNGTPPGMPTC
jgi:hypothetical protein